MSLLMFFVVPDEGIMVATDTLATGHDGTPMFFKSKCRVFPHLGLAMAGTGSGNVLDAWATKLNDSILATDIDMVALHAQRALTDVQDDLEAQLGPLPSSATIYHFGQASDEKFVWWVFRSEKSFEPERWADGGFGVKPIPSFRFEQPDGLDDWVDLAEAIRADQSQRPPTEKIWIGGELWLTVVREASFTQQLLHSFDDHEDAWLKMNGRL